MKSGSWGAIYFTCLMIRYLFPCWDMSCADPENFARGGPTLTTFSFLLFVFFVFFVFLSGFGGSKYHYKRAIIGPPAKRHLNGVSLEGVDGSTLNTGSVAL